MDRDIMLFRRLCLITIIYFAATECSAQNVYKNNPFLQRTVTLGESRRQVLYNHNPFLNGINPTPKTTQEYTPRTITRPKVYTTITRPKVYETVTREYNIDVRSSHLPNDGNYEDICGRPTMTRLAIGGENVEEGGYPWIGALYHKGKDNKISFKCGATLVTSQHAITAAHCVKAKEHQPNEVILFFGRLNLTLDYYTIDANKGVIDAKTIYIHTKYDGSSGGDIAVIQLRQPIKLTNYIRPICLWSSKKYSADFRHVVGFTGDVVGWGQNEKGELNLAGATLVKLPLIAKEQCLRTNQAYYRLVEDDTFCAGSRDGKGPCNGDSGSALALKLKDDAWYLRGVVSTALSNFGQCDLNNFVVFVDAVMHENWISGIIH